MTNCLISLPVSSYGRLVFDSCTVKIKVFHLLYLRWPIPATAKLTFPRQNLLFHGKTYFSTAKLTFPRQNLLFHGKTFFSTAKLSFSRQNLLFHGKTFFSTAKLTFSYFRNPVSLGLQFPAILDPETSDCTPADPTWRIRKKISCKYVKT